MRFAPLSVAGSDLVEPELVQCSVSFNRCTGTLRGMHYQMPPHAEAKLVRCTAGAICDVVLDQRAGSSSSMQWVAVELSADNRHAIYIPEACAHGFLALTDAGEVYYQMSVGYRPESAAGVLRLDSSKTREKLGWQPRWRLNTALEKTVAWHQAWRQGADMAAISLEQIQEYRAGVQV